ncbi:MAG: hypothetical protein U9O87_09980 [Verrucomicrobiota bacterium]|nr:hypothetical protein [Verrucomicrobiota bacterium]
MTRDPVGEWGGMNVYAFLYNNSISDIDLIGAFSFGDFLRWIRGRVTDPSGIARFFFGQLGKIFRSYALGISLPDKIIGPTSCSGLNCVLVHSHIILEKRYRKHVSVNIFAFYRLSSISRPVRKYVTFPLPISRLALTRQWIYVNRCICCPCGKSPFATIQRIPEQKVTPIRTETKYWGAKSWNWGSRPSRYMHIRITEKYRTWKVRSGRQFSWRCN